MVMITPPGSLPGMNSFASAPTINPMISDHRMCILPSPLPVNLRANGRRTSATGEFLASGPFLRLLFGLGLTGDFQDRQSCGHRPSGEGKRGAEARGRAPA